MALTGIPNINGTNYLKINTDTGRVSHVLSMRKSKKNITDASQSFFDDILKLKPRKFNWKSSNKETIYFIADEAAEANPLFATYGKDYSFDERGEHIKDEEGNKLVDSEDIVPSAIDIEPIIAGLVGKIQDLEKRIKKLENK